MKHVLLAHTGDNVASALDNIVSAETFMYSHNDQEHQVTARENIPFGFKVALADIPAGDDIIKYGEIIGKASRNIMAGECVHVHNVEGKRGRGDQQR
ncbi:UxaA family hydrolase [uncultured Desulfovibrio sp.]|uniref:UxaA family hydrolase n=1 Tax=uncultured Desulfovibrio sp. TaxID=167968 RepID=UPI002605F862|nr:UxaA family hydrolase [uncultured Desulfovibrio sp.]